ncbi:hypothetical protein WMY93_018389 [Mugilogobius chulae]|uniref:DNA-directed DNA polymerase X domain-containing protein n=1 Tax=Mugilogobius chulae TaxID=88201 RepID=A0AAW0NTW4_9GOBI
MTFFTLFPALSHLFTLSFSLSSSTLPLLPFFFCPSLLSLSPSPWSFFVYTLHFAPLFFSLSFPFSCLSLFYPSRSHSLSTSHSLFFSTTLSLPLSCPSLLFLSVSLPNSPSLSFSLALSHSFSVTPYTFSLSAPPLLFTPLSSPQRLSFSFPRPSLLSHSLSNYLHLNRSPNTDALEVLVEHYELSEQEGPCVGFRRAASVLKSLSWSVDSVRSTEGLPSVGAKTKTLIQEILQHGRSFEVEKILADEKYQTLKCVRVGPKTADKWYRQGLRSLSQILAHPGIQLNRMQQHGFLHYADLQRGIRADEARAVEAVIGETVRRVAPNAQVALTGGFRREGVGHDVDFIVTTAEEERQSSLLPLIIERLQEQQFERDLRRFARVERNMLLDNHGLYDKTQELHLDEDGFQQYFGLTRAQFDNRLSRIGACITQQDTYRHSIPAVECLSICLQFVDINMCGKTVRECRRSVVSEWETQTSNASEDGFSQLLRLSQLCAKLQPPQRRKRYRSDRTHQPVCQERWDPWFILRSCDACLRSDRTRGGRTRGERTRGRGREGVRSVSQGDGRFLVYKLLEIMTKPDPESKINFPKQHQATLLHSVKLSKLGLTKS